MVCKNCGAHYKMRDMKCPYCGTENIIGILWAQERTEAEEEYNAKCRAAGRKPSAYVYNRIISRVLFIEVIIIVLFIVGTVVFTAAYAGFKTVQADRDSAEDLALLEQAYKDRDAQTIERILDKYDYTHPDEFDKYFSTRLANMYLMDLEEDRMRFWAYPDEAKGEELSILSYSVWDAFKIFSLRERYYYDSCPDYVEYGCDTAHTYLTAMLGMTDEEIAYYCENSDEIYENSKIIADMLGERNGWKK